MSVQNDLSSPAEKHLLPSALLHDLRAPLNQIIGYAEMLAEEATGEAGSAVVPYLEKISAAGYDLLAQITNNFTAEREDRLLDDGERSFLGDAVGGEAASSPERRGGSRGYLMVVDNSEAGRDLLANRLTLEGYTVDRAEGGEEALRKLRANDFDVVLLDILMPAMDGYEVLERIKTDPKLRHLPVIMVSSLAELGSVARCIEMGADDYLTKPLHPVLLKARVQACLEQKRRRDGELKLLKELKEDYDSLRQLAPDSRSLLARWPG